MKISQYFNLGATQGSLDFVDTDVEEDVPVYIDPSAIRVQRGIWAQACRQSLQSYFSSLVLAIKAEDQGRTRGLIYPLSEPNETHLGDSSGASRGRGLGNQKKADDLIDALAKSRAVASGLLEDLDDSALFVDGIDKDIVSDITTCVIRSELVSYTEAMATFWAIPLEPQVIGALWDEEKSEWTDRTVNLPRGPLGALLLVPKSIVRSKLTTSKGAYYRNHLRPIYVADELKRSTSDLVRVLKDKSRKVRLGALDARLGTTKQDITRQTLEHPDALKAYREDRSTRAVASLSHQDLRARTGAPRVDVRALLDDVLAIAPGNQGATLYHHSIAKLMTALFDKALGNARIEESLHGGLKRIDILYDNIAADGFFDWLGQHYPAATIPVECKNYKDEVANEEFDQLAMRLSKQRGQIGLLVFRKLKKRGRALARAMAIASDHHGYILLVDDKLLVKMVDEYIAHHDALQSGPVNYSELRAQFDVLIGLGKRSSYEL